MWRRCSVCDPLQPFGVYLTGPFMKDGATVVLRKTRIWWVLKLDRGSIPEFAESEKETDL